MNSHNEVRSQAQRRSGCSSRAKLVTVLVLLVGALGATAWYATYSSMGSIDAGDDALATDAASSITSPLVESALTELDLPKEQADQWPEGIDPTGITLTKTSDIFGTGPTPVGEDKMMCVQAPTYKGRDMYRWLLYEMYARQNYKRKALFIVGQEPENKETKRWWQRIMRKDPSVTYTMLAGTYHKKSGPPPKAAPGEPPIVTLGGKRNHVFSMVQAKNVDCDVMVTFDDDDFYGHDYLATLNKIYSTPVKASGKGSGKGGKPQFPINTYAEGYTYMALHKKADEAIAYWKESENTPLAEQRNKTWRFGSYQCGKTLLPAADKDSRALLQVDNECAAGLGWQHSYDFRWLRRNKYANRSYAEELPVWFKAKKEMHRVAQLIETPAEMTPGMKKLRKAIAMGAARTADPAIVNKGWKRQHPHQLMLHIDMGMGTDALFKKGFNSEPTGKEKYTLPACEMKKKLYGDFEPTNFAHLFGKPTADLFCRLFPFTTPAQILECPNVGQRWIDKHLTGQAGKKLSVPSTGAAAEGRRVRAEEGAKVTPEEAPFLERRDIITEVPEAPII